MAGRGQRFVEANFKDPKPFIKFKNKKRLIEVVTENVCPQKYKNSVCYLAQKSHLTKKKYKNVLSNGSVIEISGITDGAACTVLLAKEKINNDLPLLIANSDQWIDFSIDDFVEDCFNRELDGSIVTFTATEEKWSFAKVNDNMLVTEVAEKKPISNIATVGVYFWKHGKDFVKYAEQMIEKNIRTNNEFYVCPVFNEAIQDNKRISIFHVENMYGFGTPEDWKKNEKLFDH